MKINPLIFKEYDVRGEYPKEINEKNAYKIGQGFVKFLKLKKGDQVAVGKDKRPSSPKLAEAFISAIIDFGIDVIDLGAVSTPMLYWSVPFLKTKGGIMITASHLSKKYNGLKFVKANAEPIGGENLQKIYKLTDNLQLTTDDKKRGSVKKYNIKKDYLGAVYKDFQPTKIKIPHSFDFDADRLIIKKMRGDIIGAIIANSFVKKGDVIVYDLRCSRAIPEYFSNKGIKTIPSRVGHFNIKKLMREKKAVFGMELTSHYYFKEFYYCEAPLYGLRKLAEHIAKTKKTLDELAKPFMKYAHSGTINIKILNLKPQILNLIEKLKDEYKNASQNFLDGLTVEFSNWWFNIRASHTEPVTRLVIEAKTPALLKQKKKELLQEIKLNR
ncbi:MAG: hypothetical protein HY773_02435 [Candidatus Terrybacteria bacterium]|nr:hypothetical protein [Candidatus Terrybacteria bacterium]